jgi:hypothetical protein
MSLIFTLFYRRGSFAQSEIFDSLSNAMSGASVMFNVEGCSGFSIEDGAHVVMRHAQIQEHCQAARAAILTGIAPAH